MADVCDMTPSSPAEYGAGFEIELKNICEAAVKGAYSKEEILGMCRSVLLHDPEHFYQRRFVSFAGKTVDTEELYSEVVSEFLLENIDELKAKAAFFKDSQREPRYSEVNELFETPNLKDTVSAETLLEKTRDDTILNSMGKFIGIQAFPADAKEASNETPNLIAYKEDAGLLWVVTMKYPDNEDDSMLKTILETYIRFKLFDDRQLIKRLGLPEDTVTRPAVLVYRNSRQGLELKQDRPMQWSLMRHLSVEAFSIRESSDIREELGRVLQRATGKIPECVIEHPVPFRQNPQIYTKDLIREVDKRFMSRSPIAARFCSECPDIYDACLKIISDPRKMSAILITNSLGTSPMKAMAEYLSDWAPIYHGQYVREPFDTQINPNGKFEAHGIDELLAFVFMDVLEYVEQKRGYPVNMLGIKTASRFLHGPHYEFSYE